MHKMKKKCNKMGNLSRMWQNFCNFAPSKFIRYDDRRDTEDD